MERRTARMTRRKSTPADQEPPTSQSWLESNNGIFMQRKPQAHVKNDWDDDFELVLSQNGSKQYRVPVDDGETVELRLMCNSNFWVMPAPKNGSGSGADSGIDEDGLPTGRSSFYYYDLFHLTAKHGGLGLVKGPGTWVFTLRLDPETGNLLVFVSCLRGGNLSPQARLSVPLWVKKDTHLFLNVDLDELERMAPGARKEQNDHISGRADRRRAEFLRKQRQPESRTPSEAMDRAPSPGPEPESAPDPEPEPEHVPEPEPEPEAEVEAEVEASWVVEPTPKPPRREPRWRLPPLRPGPGRN